MQILTHFTAFFALARYALAGEHGTESPFGLTFSPSAVFASRFNSSGSIEITKFPLSSDSEYHTYYSNAIRVIGKKSDSMVDAITYYKSTTHLDATSMFKSIIGPVTDTLKQTLGHVPKYSTFFLPSVFEDRLRNAAADAFSLDASRQPAMHGPSQLAACHAFDFLGGRYLGRASTELNDEGPENLVLLLEYEKDYLYVWLKEVAFHLGTYPVDSQKICKECGERFREEIGAQAYEERVSRFLVDFAKTETRDDIRAFVIAGEASAEGVSALSLIARKVVGTEGLQYVTEVDPSEVVAHGAAQYARMVQKMPHAFKTSEGNVVVEHEEL